MLKQGFCPCIVLFGVLVSKRCVGKVRFLQMVYYLMSFCWYVIHCAICYYSAIYEYVCSRFLEIADSSSTLECAGSPANLSSALPAYLFATLSSYIVSTLPLPTRPFVTFAALGSCTDIAFSSSQLHCLPINLLCHLSNSPAKSFKLALFHNTAHASLPEQFFHDSWCLIYCTVCYIIYHVLLQCSSCFCLQGPLLPLAHGSPVHFAFSQRELYR